MSQRPRQRSRSRSPVQGMKLHVKNLPVQYTEEALQQVFETYGEIKDIKIIRKGNNGQPLRECVYGFIVMPSPEVAERAMKELNSKGWSINYSKEALQKPPAPILPQVPREIPKDYYSYTSFPQMVPQAPRVSDIMPGDQSFQHNAQATNIMLLNNANPKPGQPMDRGMLERLLSEHQPSAFNISGVPEHFKGFFLVREVWIGNISPATDKQLLYDAFKEYGDIEGIEMFSSKGFAFIKYRKVVAATRAYERADGTIVDGRPVKVAFADPTRRIDIVGDSLIPENPNFNPIDDEHFKNLFLGYPPGATVPPEHVLREVFSRYGRVKRISIRQATSNSRPYAFVDFERGDQASEARKHLYIEDFDGSRRRELGDSGVEISFKNTNNIVSKNGTKNGVRYQDKSGKEEISDIAKKLMEQPAALQNLLRFQTMFSMGGQPQMFPNMTTQYPNLNMQPYPNTSPAPSSSGSPSTKVSSKEKVPEPDDPHLGSVIWSGFMTRSKNYRVGIDATLVKGRSECFPSTLYHINISHRVAFQEIFKFYQLALVTFEASNETQQEVFKEYVNYFSEKQRAGYIQMKNSVLYVCPPIEEIKKIYPNLEDGQLLGVFVDPTKKAEKPKDSSKIQELLNLLKNHDVIKHFNNKSSGPSPSDPRLALKQQK